MGDWISSKDRVPEIHNNGYSDIVLMAVGFDNFLRVELYTGAYLDDADLGLGWYYFGGEEYGFERVNEMDAVTHWMPLPEPPEVTLEMIIELCEWRDDGEEETE